jgi:SET domain-containing protein
LKLTKHNANSIEAAESDYLFVGPSQLPDSGNGLYTAIAIYKDEVISLFKGEILTTLQAKLRANKGHDKYFISLPNGTMMDSMRVACFAKYANDAEGFSKSAFKNSAKIALDEDNQVCIIATRHIKANEEIFCGYGKAYWKKHS